MIVNLLLFLAILFVANFIPYWLLVSSNRYTYLQGLIFGCMFIGVWLYIIASQIEIINLKKMDLKEKIYASSRKSKARIRRKYHDPWDYIAVNIDKIENQIEDRENKISWLLKSLTLDAFIVTLFAIAGRRRYRMKSDYYTNKIYLYLSLTIFCFTVELINNFYVIDG